MTSILHLFVIKTYAKIRNIFKKPASAIITLLVIAIYGFSIISALLPSSTPEVDGAMKRIYFLAAIGFCFLIMMITMNAKKVALFFEEDSYYLFIGPFKNKQILAYLNFANGMQSIMIGLMAGLIPLMMFQSAGSFNLDYVMMTSLMCGLIAYILITIIDIFYVKDIIDNEKRGYRRYLSFFLLACILGVMGYHYLTSSMNLSDAFMQFIASPTFNYIPIIGWSNYALVSYIEGNLLMTLAMVALVIAVAVGVSLLLVNIKGYFFEQAMIDATEFTEMYRKAREGKTNVNEVKKVHKATVQFRAGEGALFSKSLLTLKKTRKLLNISEITMLAVMIIVFGLVFDFGFIMYSFMSLFYLMNSMSVSSIEDELRHLYIYLIPGSPFKKLLNVIAIPFLRTALFGLIMMVSGIVLYRPEPLFAIFATITVLSFTFTLYGADIVTLRVLKTRRSAMTTQMIRMFIQFVTIIPSVLLGIAIGFGVGDIYQALPYICLVISIVNISFGLLMFYLCRKMLSGDAYLED